MYTHNNNRIITKYSEFLKEQAAVQPDFVPPSVIKHVITDPYHPFSSLHDLEVDSDSGRESPTAHTSSTLTITSAEVHNIIESEEGEGSISTGDPTKNPLTCTPPPPGLFTSSKFSDLFSPEESHALFQRDLFVQSEEGGFMREGEEGRPRRPSSSIASSSAGTPKVNHRDIPEKVDPKHELPIIISQSRDGTSEVTGGSHSSVHNLRRSLPLHAAYPPSPSSSSLAETEVTLRRELLNNIRAISRATFFEKLYTGNTTKSGGDGLEIDLGESSDTNNNPSTTVANDELEALLRADSPPQTLVVSEKGELLVFESVPPGRREGSKAESRSVLEVNGLGGDVTERDKESSIHQWILNSQHESEAEGGGVPAEVTGEISEVPYYSSPEIAPDKASPNGNADERDEEHRKPPTPADVGSLRSSVVPMPRPTKGDNASSDGHPDSELPPSSSASSLEKLPKRLPPPPRRPLTPPHVSKMIDSDSSRFTPIFSRVELEGDGGTNRVPMMMLNRRRRRSFLPPALTVPLKNLTFSVLSPLTHKQVRYPSALPKRLSPPIFNPGSKNGRFRGNIPGVLLRTNMDQWVAKIVRFYVNGDEHLPRFEYRFRPGRDVHSFESLCDILSERLKLTCGVRYVFTLQGHPIWSLDDLRHESAYVVSSTKKFKALNYGGELMGVEGNPKGGHSKRRGRSRPPSAPSNRNPPIIRVRRERSLNGVVWGSPQQDWSSGSERNGGNLQRSTIEAEKVLRAAIEESQAGFQGPPQSGKQIIRIINGSDPTIQSQVLLNTRVSQEFQDLVKDLGLAVKIPRGAQTRMETLTGRAIQSYSQLRSHLKAGTEAFYIYNLSTSPNSSKTGRGHGGQAHLLPDRTSPFGALSKSVSNPTLGHLETSLGKKFPKSIIHLTPGGGDRLQLPGVAMNKSSSSSSIYHGEVSGLKGQKQVKPPPQNTHPTLSNSSSHPNLHQKRKSLRERYETSKYLAHHTSRSRSPSP